MGQRCGNCRCNLVANCKHLIKLLIKNHIFSDLAQFCSFVCVYIYTQFLIVLCRFKLCNLSKHVYFVYFIQHTSSHDWEDVVRPVSFPVPATSSEDEAMDTVETPSTCWTISETSFISSEDDNVCTQISLKMNK